MDTLRASVRNGVAARTLTLGLLACALWLVLPYLPGLVGAGVLYVVALPVVRWLDPRRRGRIAPFATMVAVFIVLVLPGAWLLVELVSQVPDAARSLQHSDAIVRLMATRVGDLNVGLALERASNEIISWSSRRTLTAIRGILQTTINLVVALFGAYYMLTAGSAFWDHVQAVLPLPSETAERLRVRFKQVTEGMLIGVVLTGATQGVLVGVAFATLGVPQPALWGAVTAVVSVLPMFGSALVWMPAVILLFAQGRSASALVLGVLGAVLISNIDNLLRIAVYRRVSQVHPMVTLVGAFAGVTAFGIAGLLVGPLLLSYLIELLRTYRAADPIIESAA